MPDVETGPMTPLDQWKLHLAQMPHAPRILHCGAKTWPCLGKRDPSVHWQNGDWVGTDMMAGDGVEIVGDLHTLYQTCPERFDAVFCNWVLEHLERPWAAIHSMAHLLNPRGALFIGTHQTFPLHGYPNDYFRFSTSALKLMAEDSGLKVTSCQYDTPCTITPPAAHPTVWNPLGKAFLHVSICAVKP
jgi:hypothetical protein